MLCSPLCAVLAAIPDLAFAQSNAPSSERVVNVSIRAQPLASALDAFSRATGWEVGYSSSIVRGKTSRPVSGSMAPMQALQGIVAGNGITIRLTGPTTAVLARPEAAASDAVGSIDGNTIELDPVVVQARAETAWGPVPGYVARQSASATKTDTPLIKTPQSVTVVGRKEIETRQAQSVSDVLRYTPGIDEPIGTASQRDNLYSRGFQATQFLDGLRLTDGSWGINQIDPYMLERVERIGGPASVLYGQASPGGVIELVSKRPTEEPYHEIAVQTGSYRRLQGMFDFSGPLNDDKTLLYRLTGIARTTETQIDFTRDRRLAVAPSITWKPDADTDLTIFSTYQNDPDLGEYYTLPAVGTVLPNPNGKIPSSRYVGEPSYDIYSRQSASIGYSFEHRFNDTWTLRQNLRYSYMDAEFGGVLPFGLQDDNRTLDRYAMYDRDKLGQFTVDTNAQAKFDTGPLQHTALFGIDYQRTTLEQIYGFNWSVTPLDIFNPVYQGGIGRPELMGDDRQVANQLGLYGQDQIDIGNLSVVGGLRYDWSSVDTTDWADHSTKVNDHALTGRIGAVYRFDNGLAPYASYSTSFQPELGTNLGSTTFKPTEGKQIEAGIKYQPVGYNGFITASYFDLKKTNVKTSTGIPGLYRQTGEVHARGVELSAVATLFDSFNIRASYAHLLATNSRTNEPTLLGKDVVGTPRDSASIWGDYTFASGRLAGLTLGLGVRYQGSRYGDDENTFKVPSFTVVDAAISYDLAAANARFAGWKASLNATNLFDKEYVSSCWSRNLCGFGKRRTVIGTLAYRW
ncbi:TonB-dependent siderophore receptor [Labrys sp. WJW]|uniref:TonB-dependent siderophore receptor n=1 Tax=Labrys sp. WJW TaxID=1737983 RepID=UPI00138FDDB7|nr:TonB-dependent siderophore receptor [Labrys sp. WJW]